MLLAGTASLAGLLTALRPASAAPQGSAAATRWPVATGYRAEGYHARNLQAMGEALAQASGGAFSLEVRADNSLVPMAGIPAAVAGGQPPLGEAIMTGLSRRWPVCGADAVPFLTRSLDDAQRLWRAQRPVVEAALAPAGLGVLLAVPWPGQGLYTRQAVTSPEDLRGLRIRTYNPTTVRIAELLGATPVDVPMAGIGQALAEGRIDALITSAVTGVEQQVWRWLTHFQDLNAWMPKNLVMVNAAALKALPAPHREALLRVATDAEARGWAACRQAGQDALATLQANRMSLDATPPPLARQLQRLGERFSREWVREVGPQANAIFIPYYTQS
ncbi:TRAP transporter substrate-binding protein [Ideonella sp. TBM-1]|uniref:TRAP transporter substrate-binding protein n=2 Tax=Ideonella livida TaxID=2707176 RepID=A0A7C9TH93_9BURK|nr:TRAP transporter substrate-binding protein [Ideonella livida]